MAATLLLTSFQTWLPHQRSNTSDDLLVELVDRQWLPDHYHLLRLLPVDFQLAPASVIAKIDQLQPQVVVCCGMAETRQPLTVELQGTLGEEVFTTSLDLNALVAELAVTEISRDAGRFVCNHLYYSILKHVQERQLQTTGLFVHVPLLTAENLDAIVTDFRQLLTRIERLHDSALPVNRLS